MKKTKSIIMATLIGVSALVLNGCSGKDGAPGAQGPEGNANVLTMAYSILPSQWAYSSPVLWVDLIDNDITADIMNSGAVLVYMENGSYTTQLPYTYYPTTTYSETMSAIHYLGNVEIDIQDSDAGTPGTPGPISFKVVTLSSRKMLQNPHVNFKDYESVKRAFNLK